jgi:hypothetical protein
MRNRCVCGKEYWPSQRWIHEKCEPHHEPQKLEKPVVHAVEKVVHGDRHKKTPERMFYRRFWMQARRAVEAGRACLWPRGV